VKTAEWWAEEAIKEATDPSHVSSQPTAIPMANHQIIQFLKEVRTGLNQSSICRRRSCLFITLNTNRIENYYGHFRCPLCGEQYEFEPKASLVKAQKILVVDEQEPDIVVDMGYGGKTLVSQRSYFLCEWEEAEVMVHTMKQICTGLNSEFAAMSSAMAMHELHEFVREHGHRVYFAQYTLTADIKNKIDELNNFAGGLTKLWKYDHLFKPFIGLKLNRVCVDTIDKEVLTSAQLIRFWALNRFGLNRAAASRNSGM